MNRSDADGKTRRQWKAHLLMKCELKKNLIKLVSERRAQLFLLDAYWAVFASCVRNAESPRSVGYEISLPLLSNMRIAWEEPGSNMRPLCVTP